jgi:uncharacterized membrane protein
MRKIIFVIITLLILCVVTNNASAQFTEYDYEIMNDIISALETFTLAIWIFVIIIVSLLAIFIALCVSLIRLNKKYLQKIDQIIEVKHGEAYASNWKNNDSFRRY